MSIYLHCGLFEWLLPLGGGGGGHFLKQNALDKGLFFADSP